MNAQESDRESNHTPDPQPSEVDRLLSICTTLEADGTYDEAWETGMQAVRLSEAQDGKWSVELGRALTRLTRVAWFRAAWQEGIETGERAVQIFQRLQIDPSSDLAKAMENLAIVLQPDPERARQLLEQVLAIKEKLCDPHDMEIARTLNNLANNRVTTGAYIEALPLFERVLSILETREAAPLQLAQGLNNLGMMYALAGRYVDAGELLPRAVALREVALPPEHPLVAASLTCLGCLRADEGAVREAIHLFERALAIRDLRLPPGHQDIGQSCSNLAEVYILFGQLQKAEPLLLRALANRRDALGPTDPLTAMMRSSLGRLCAAMGNYEEAKELCMEACANFVTVPNPQHPLRANCLSNLGHILHARGDYCEAEGMLMHALQIRNDVLGDFHPHTVESQRNLLPVALALEQLSPRQPE